ncbi:MAG: 1-deoxy-D-xylulose-5-phosphate reductoisomerase, partial [Candidatus Omnitrophica bacterium]|nr:1-deoxy-D-xylulose-5-phosphate reductoisomerase [Candidatus Omnitrophota bacterium]
MLNAADEVAVEAYLKEKIKFSSIYNVVEKVVLKHKGQARPALSAILDADAWAREETEKWINKN